MKNVLKKLLSFVLALTMVCTYSITVNAESYNKVKVSTEGQLYEANKAGNEIALTEDITLNQVVSFNNVTLDLNGHKLSQGNDITDDFFIRCPNNTVIKDSIGTGSIESSKITVYVTGSLTLESGTINNIGNTHTVYVSGKGTFEMNGGIVESNKNGVRTDSTSATIAINDGQIESKEVGIYSTGAKDITVNDGNITAAQFGLYVEKTSLNINGGIINASVNDAVRINGNTSTIIKSGDLTNSKRESLYITGDNVDVAIYDGQFKSIYDASTNKYVYGGTYTVAPYNHLGAGYYATKDETTNKYVVNGCEGKVGDTYYQTFENALTAAANSDDHTVILLKDINKSITVLSHQTVVLDLNGHTLSGTLNSQGAMSNVVTNKGVLTIKDSSDTQSGTIMGGTDTGNQNKLGRQGIALVNDGTCTIESGNIKRGDDKTFGNYTVQNNGDMVINGGSISNNSNVSSLVVNSERVNKNATLTINGGTISQPSGIAVKTESGKLTITGGTLYSETSFALQCWTDADVTGGNINGAVSAFSYKDIQPTLNITGGTIGQKDVPTNIRACNYIENGVLAEKAPQINISDDAVVYGDLELTVYNNGYQATHDRTIATINVSGGTFDRKVPNYVCANGYQCLDDDTNESFTVTKCIAINYDGGSLLTKESYEKVNMCFGYTFSLPEGCSIDDVELVWNWGTKADNLNRSVKMAKYVENNDGTYTANLVITNIPVTNGGYNRNIYAQLVATYNGETTTLGMLKQNIDQVRAQSTETVVNDMIENADEEHKAYAQKLKELYGNN